METKATKTTKNTKDVAESQVSTSDYAFVSTPARIAIYDDKLSAPRIVLIEPAPTNEFIEQLASSIYTLSQEKGGKIPYTAIREVSENFIHAQFKEIVVSILENGNTIRYSDQGPGIENIEKAQLPGFTSATEPMKSYIRGVGSGLPIVKEYLSFTNGSLTIEDNLNQGTVVTLRLNGEEKTPIQKTNEIPRSLLSLHSKRERQMLDCFMQEPVLGVTELSKLMEIGVSSVSVTLTKLEEAGLVEKLPNKKRMLTDFGRNVAISQS